MRLPRYLSSLLAAFLISCTPASCDAATPKEPEVLVMPDLNLQASSEPADPAADAGADKALIAVPIDDINKGALKPAVDKMDELVKAGAKTLYLRINSFGGAVFDGETFVQTLESYNRKGVHTICIADGANMSMAFYLLQGCQERWTTKRTTFLAHEPWTQAQGNRKALDAAAHNMGVTSDAMSEFIGRKLTIGVDGYKKKISHGDWTFGWAEAKAVGAVDKVVEPEDIPQIAELEHPKNMLELLLGGSAHTPSNSIWFGPAPTK